MAKDEAKKYKWATFLNETENANCREVMEYLYKNKYTDRKSMYVVVKFALMHIYDEMLDDIEEKKLAKQAKLEEDYLDDEIDGF